MSGPLGNLFEVRQLIMHRLDSVMRVRAKAIAVSMGEDQSKRGVSFVIIRDDTIPLNAQVASQPSGTLHLNTELSYTGELMPGTEFWLDITPIDPTAVFEHPRLSGWTMFMKRMGFSSDPGPLPLTTIRSQKWANYTWVGEIIEIHGEHGCPMVAQAARVTAITPYAGPCPAHLASIYKGQKLFQISLESVDDESLRRVGLRQPPP